MIGRTLSHYHIEEKLGEGGMGVVYKARDTHLDRPVAIKVLRSDAVSNPERKQRFVREAKSASALNHQNIITIHDIDTAEGVDFIAMEYVAGRPLDRLIGHRGLPMRDTLHYAVQIAGALATAHAAAIVHRDLKPANIMVTEDGPVKVLDFGLAKLAETGERDENEATRTRQEPHTEEGAIVGTVAYMSPEQAQGKKVDARSDIFSFGVMLYEMLSGQRPFHGKSRIETLSAILQKEPKSLGEVVPGIPRDLERIVTLAMRKEADRRFQHMADVKVELLVLKEESDSGKLASAPAIAPAGTRWRLVVPVAAVLLVAGAGAIFWWRERSRAATERPTLTRLTSDSGLTTDPAISPDGKLLAFASDRSGEGHLDIWVRQVAGGEPIRLTTQHGDDLEPSFSSDGAKIAFSSEGDGRGVYVVPALGGAPRLVARGGRRPRYSPDGEWIAYWVGEYHNLGDIYVVASTGGTPRKVQLNPVLFGAMYPAWSPDGRSLLFLGSENFGDTQTLDWWTAPAEGGRAERTRAFEVFGRQQLPTSIFMAPGDWWNDRVFFSARSGDSTALWQIPISPKSRRVSGDAGQITFGTGFDTKSSVAAGGQLVFTSLAENIDVWNLPIDANQGKPRGEPQRLTRDAALDLHPSVTADGKKMVFRSDRSGNPDIWLKDLETGRETRLTVDLTAQVMPLIAPDHPSIAYRSVDRDKSATFVLSVGPRGYAGPGEEICDDCGFLSDLSSDGSRTLHYLPDPANRLRTLLIVDAHSREKSVLIQREGTYPVDPRFSLDGRWIAFHEIIERSRRQIFIAPLRPGAATPRSEWIPVTDGSAMDRFPTFSPDGNLLYFISERDGFRCIAAQRLDPATKRPAGPMFYVYHFHGAQRSMMNFQNANWSRLSVARDKIVFSLAERTGNIWMMKLPP